MDDLFLHKRLQGVGDIFWAGSMSFNAILLFLFNPPQLSKVHLPPRFLEHWHHLVFPSSPVAPSGDTVLRPRGPWSNHWNDLPNVSPRSCDTPRRDKEHHPWRKFTNAPWKMRVRRWTCSFWNGPFFRWHVHFSGGNFQHGWKFPNRNTKSTKIV